MNQPLPLVEQLKNLEHLQELDLKIDSLKKGQSSLPGNLKSIDDALGKLQGSVESKRNQISEIEKTQKQTRAALELNQDRLARASTKLEGVQNSQEFQAANKEIDQLKKLHTSLEEQGLKSQEDSKLIQVELTGLDEQLQKLKTERDAQVSVVSGQDSQFKMDIAALVSERSKYLPGVEPRILAQYDRVRAARNGLGIVPAIAGRCKGCNMVVPPQLYNEVQKGSTLHSCPSCHRILFVPSTSATGKPEEGKLGT